MENNSNTSSAARNISRRDTFKYKLLLEGIIVGAISGVLIAGFRLLLSKADELRTSCVLWVRNGTLEGQFGIRLAIAAAVLLVIALIISFLLKWEPECSGSGIPQVEGEIKGKLDMDWLKVIAAKLLGCVLAIGGGLALGREGPSVQLGAMAGKGFARARHRLLTEERLLITCGAGAGLSAAFGAPLAGALFALEELHRTFSALVLITTMASAAVSDWVASAIIGRQPVFDIPVEQALPFKYYWLLIILGLLLGALGAIYNRTLDRMQNLFTGLASRLNDRHTTLLKLLAIFSISLLMIYVYPQALGSGANIVANLCRENYALPILAVLLMVKFVYSTASFGSGAPGGIFLPLLVLGAVAGSLFARASFDLFGIDDIYMESFVIVAMAGMFAAIVRAPATGIILITEMTASFSSLLALVTVSLLAYITADALGAQPVYEQLWNKRSGRTKLESDEAEGNRRLIIQADVQMASSAENKSVMDLGLPKGCLIVAIERDGKEIIPNGSTELKAGDHLEVLCRKKDLGSADKVLDAKCMHHRRY